MFDAIIFDLDGTLIDSESVAVATGLRVFAAHGHPVTEALFHSLIGVDGDGSTALLRAALGPDAGIEALRADWMAAFRAHVETEGVPLRPGAADLLDQLSALGHRLAVATSSRRAGAEWKLGRAGLLGHFATLVTRDCVTNAKPHPEPFLLAADRLGAAPARCLAFEDSDIGARSAMAAGMTVVQVPDVLATDGRHATLVAPDLLSGARTLGLIG
ncbi:HAD family phosphatase [Gemmobacter sp.]|uniref:HAD family hydrolase n=1 Tax=Gemmobacter sp. TaxID=1898957 RepID=UPI002AFE891A|nr:HAD family phosphatase [Gemmobacter sp.]